MGNWLFEHEEWSENEANYLASRKEYEKALAQYNNDLNHKTVKSVWVNSLHEWTKLSEEEQNTFAWLELAPSHNPAWSDLQHTYSKN